MIKLNEMKKIDLIISLFFLSVIISLTGCDDQSASVVGPVNNYTFEVEDTVVSALSHEFEVGMIDEGYELPRDWSFWRLQIWDNTKPMEEYKIDENWIFISKDKYISIPDGIDYDWISFRKIITDGTPKLKVILKENDTMEQRTVKISVYNEWDNKNGLSFGEVIITQKGRPDSTPYEMKVRYKGKIYSSMVHQDIEENIIFEDSEFEAFIKEIESHAGIEMVIYEDDIVDYIDNSDKTAKAALKKVYEKFNDPSRTCPLELDLPMTRGQDGFRFMESGALGYCAMFDDKNYSDTHVYSNLYNLMESYDIQYFRSVGLNDKVTSLAVGYNGFDAKVCAVLTIWEDSYFNFEDYDRTKHRISIVATKENPRVGVGSLKSVKCINSSNSWNDRISSSSFHFGYYDKSLKDY